MDSQRKFNGSVTKKKGIILSIRDTCIIVKYLVTTDPTTN